MALAIATPWDLARLYVDLVESPIMNWIEFGLGLVVVLVYVGVIHEGWKSWQTFKRDNGLDD